MLKLHLSRVDRVYGFRGNFWYLTKQNKKKLVSDNLCFTKLGSNISIHLSFPTIFYPVSFIDSKSSHTPVSYCIICVVFCSLVLNLGYPLNENIWSNTHWLTRNSRGLHGRIAASVEQRWTCSHWFMTWKAWTCWYLLDRRIWKAFSNTWCSARCNTLRLR